MSRFRLDPSTRRPGGGTVVIGGSPLRLFRLTPAGRRVMEAVERGDEPPPGHERLTDRLLDAGAIHPLYDHDAHGAVMHRGDVTVVCPARDPVSLAAVVAAAAGTAGLVIVDDASSTPVTVDDASSTPVTVDDASSTNVTIVRVDVNAGPGAARNAGMALVSSPLVAFVDADVELPDDWLEVLLHHFDDPRLGAVAPRVASSPGPSLLARYEQVRSPLDLGPAEGRVRAGSRISYVPAAVLVCRRDAVAAAGGFDSGLRFGEDVDLVWRLDEAGWLCRYEPQAVAHHAPRPTWRAWAGQRVAYGSSAAPLAHRHQGALAPVRVSSWSAGVWVLIAIRQPVTAIGVAAGTIVALARKLGDLAEDGLDVGAESARLAGLGHLHAGRLLADAIRRVWWPVAAIAAWRSRRARRVVLASLLPLLIERLVPRRRDVANSVDPARYVAIRLADDIAYGTGVWRGVWRERTLAPVLPDLSGWPDRRDGDEYRRRR